MAATQIEINHRAYADRHRHLEAAHTGEFALMHDGDVAHIYGGAESAYHEGVRRFGRDRFSVKEIGAQPVKLGGASLTI